MGCLPSSGCERFLTEPLVVHLNQTEGTVFSYERCLDKLDRNRHQPEILYVDRKTDQRLVIEVKNLVWPLDYAKRHQSDHFVAHRIAAELGDVLSDAPYALTLPNLVVGKRAELEEFAVAIAEAIKTHLASVKADATIGSRRPGRQWRLRKQQLWEREPGEPETGVWYEWWGPDLFDLERVRTALKDLSGELRRHYISCTAKFADYQDARRILLVKPTGDVFLGEDDWRELLTAAPPPETVPEIWRMNEYETGDDQTALEFARVHPARE